MSKPYLEFELIEKKPKTNVYSINSIASGFKLGIVKWFSSWRQYCFFPNEGTVFDQRCMKDIRDFMQKLMSDRKKIKEELIKNNRG